MSWYWSQEHDTVEELQNIAGTSMKEEGLKRQDQTAFLMLRAIDLGQSSHLSSHL